MEKIQFKKSFKPYVLTKRHCEPVSMRFPAASHYDFNIETSPTGNFMVLTIYTGARWDGPSGPTVDTNNFMRASLVHDLLYEGMNSGHIPKSLRKQADRELYRICREDGMPWLRAQYVYRAVRWFGGLHV